MVNEVEDAIKISQNSENPVQESGQVVQNSSADAANGDSTDGLFSPRFRSAAAMAGWDEEALMVATLVVEDTPDRQQHSKHRKNQRNNFKTPPSTNSRRKRRAQRRSPTSMPVVVLNLEEEDQETAQVEPPKESETDESIAGSMKEEKESSEKGTGQQGSEASTSNHSTISCIDRLREELSCAICLEICFEPSTTPCGHSFCKQCLRSAADKCGKRCPKCRQLISNGRSCTVNTVLWNTIQLLFPQEVELRKAAAVSASNDRQVQQQQQQSLVRPNPGSARHRRLVQELRSIQGAESRNDSPSRRNSTRRHSSRPSSRTLLRRRNELPSQDEDAALALRLQREEFIGVYRGSSADGEYSSSIAMARANLRAMASRALRGL